MSITRLAAPEGYEPFLKDLKERIRTAQVRAALAVNRELVLLYWSIGKDILTQQKQHGWGAKIIDQLAADLRNIFPGMTGFSSPQPQVHAGLCRGLAQRANCAAACCTNSLVP